MDKKILRKLKNVTAQYPIIADENKIVASLYDMIHPGDDTFAKCVLFCLL
jgi:alkyl hydroperoxide reductase subunit AhpC